MGKFLFFLAVFIFAASQCAALSDVEYRQMYNSSSYFRNADDDLTATWKSVTGNISARDKKRLLEDQRNWLKSERDEEARELMEKGFTRDCAYARVAKRRTGILKVFQYNANLAQADKDAGRARPDDYYYDEDEDRAPAECMKK